MLESVLAALNGADPFEATWGVGLGDARRLLAQQWQELDRLAKADPAAYGEHLKAVASEAGMALPPAFVERAVGSAAAGEPASGSKPLGKMAGGSKAGDDSTTARAPTTSLLQQLATCARQQPSEQEAADASSRALNNPCTHSSSSGQSQGPSNSVGVPIPGARGAKLCGLIQEVEPGGCAAQDGSGPKCPMAPEAGPSSAHRSHQVSLCTRRGTPRARVVMFGVAGTAAGDVRVQLHGQRTLLVWLRSSGSTAASFRVELPRQVHGESASARLDLKKQQLVVGLPLVV